MTSGQENVIQLPAPSYDSDISVEQSLLHRRSTRSFTGEAVTIEEVAQLLWAAQGVTDPGGLRTAPSAGALYPLEVYLVAGNVQVLKAGVYKYIPGSHELVRVIDGDKRARLADAALEQFFVAEGAAVIVFTAVYERTIDKYGDRGIRYVHMDAGHAAQNMCLQAIALGLGVVTVGAFYSDQVSNLLALPEDERPLYIIPVGRTD
jgi:SagB-type dehydrogenase family enzyme